MTDYDVIITPDAENDLNELDDYISVTLQSPDIAIAYIRTIKGNRSILQVSQKKSPKTQRGYGGLRPPEIRRWLRLSQTHELSIPRLAKHARRNA